MAYVDGPPFWMTFVWPIGYISSMLIRDPNEKKPKLPKPAGVSYDHLPLIFFSFRTCLLTLAVMYLTYDGYDYPAFGRAKTLQLSWMLPIIIRNFIGLFVICIGWDYLLYLSPLKQKLHKYKFDPIYPSRSQWLHDTFWSITATICGSLIEIHLCYCYANGIFTYKSKSILDEPVKNFLWMCFATHIRLPHFYCIHRFLHPWRTKFIPDFGKMLYKYVHSLHHKSYSPTAVSGTSMHPVEATLYYSAGYVPALFGVHPLIPIATVVDCAIGAWIGHDGFGWPGGADFYHQLHHWHFDCNYGNPQIPLDWFFGTDVSCQQDLKKRWGKVKNVGRVENEKICPTHK